MIKWTDVVSSRVRSIVNPVVFWQRAIRDHEKSGARIGFSGFR